MKVTIQTIAPEQREFIEARDQLARTEQLVQGCMDAWLTAHGIDPDVEDDSWINDFVDEEVAWRKYLDVPTMEARYRVAELGLLSWGLEVLKAQPGYKPMIQEMINTSAVYRDKALKLMLKLRG